MQPTLNDVLSHFDSVASDTARHEFLGAINLASIEDRLAFSETGYTYTSLCRRDDYELVLIGWRQGQFTPVHGHGHSMCSIHVLQGELLETHYDAVEQDCEVIHVEQHCKTLRASDRTSLAGEQPLHRILCTSERAVTLHLYSPPL